ncbi:BRO family protein [Lactobacillus delbrueckii]|uniref:BRO family protein n=1 Tax=Lactobacillus delbrueckii TaxID=1584 RepID=UPI0030E8BD3A
MALFLFEGTEEIRAIQIDGESWFIGKDVAKVLGYSNPQKAALRDHVDIPPRLKFCAFPAGGAGARG